MICIKAGASHAEGFLYRFMWSNQCIESQFGGHDYPGHNQSSYGILTFRMRVSVGRDLGQKCWMKQFAKRSAYSYILGFHFVMDADGAFA